MATRLQLKRRDRYLVGAEDIATITGRYADAADGPIPFRPLWGYGQHDPPEVWLRRDEILNMSLAADRGTPPAELE